jgi:AcrR family transcriptional regulator
MQHIAARAGVGKPTIYRRWRNKEILLRELFESMIEKPPQVPEKGLEEDLVAAVEDLHRWAAGGGSVRYMPHLLAEAERYPELCVVYFRTVLIPRIALMRRVLAKARGRGELRSDIAPDVVVDMLLGSAFVRLAAFPPRPSDTDHLHAYAAMLVSAFLDGVAADAGHACHRFQASRT